MLDTFTAPASSILDELTKTVDHYVDEASLTTSFGVSEEGERRLRAAALRPDVNDIKPDPGVRS